jgi:hypothetical protein
MATYIGLYLQNFAKVIWLVNSFDKCLHSKPSFPEKARNLDNSHSLLQNLDLINIKNIVVNPRFTFIGLFPKKLADNLRNQNQLLIPDHMSGATKKHSNLLASNLMHMALEVNGQVQKVEKGGV